MRTAFGNHDRRRMVLRGDDATALEREERLVEILCRVGDAAAAERDLEEVLQLVTDEVTTLVGAQFGALFYRRHDSARSDFRLYASTGAPPSAFRPSPQPALAAGSVVRLDDAVADSPCGRDPASGAVPVDRPVRSYLAVPLLARGEVAGCLVFGHEQAGIFGEEAERLARGVATLAGLAVSRARTAEAEREARAAAEERAKAALTLDHLGDGVALTDGEGLVRVWNRAAERITGVPASTVLDLPLTEAVPGWADVEPRVPVGSEVEPECHRTLPLDIDGAELWLSICGTKFDDGVVYTFRDVTDERELEEFRADLITTVSHEIRTPVAAVYGAARTLLRGGLEPDVNERLLAIVVSESERLATLVGEILLASAIDAGRLAVAREEVDLAEVVRKGVASSEAAAGDGHLELELPGGAACVVADPDRVGQVLANLLENAFKYGKGGENGGVVVRVLPREETVRVEVCDRGPGIPEAEHGRIFEKFHRLDAGLEEGVRGSGLGLYISRELVLRMQGTMGVESAEGEGSTFWFELPQPVAP